MESLNEQSTMQMRRSAETSRGISRLICEKDSWLQAFLFSSLAPRRACHAKPSLRCLALARAPFKTIREARKEGRDQKNRNESFSVPKPAPMCAWNGEDVRAFAHARCVDGLGTGVGGFLRVLFTP